MNYGEDFGHNDRADALSGDNFHLNRFPDYREIHFQYEVLNAEQIMEDMNECISEVNCITRIRPVITRILLNHLRWDKDKLYNIFFEGDKQKLYEETKVFDYSHSSPVRKQKFHPSSPLSTCLICYGDYSDSEMEESECGHKFCLNCWEEYLRTKILAGMAETIRCAAHRCNSLIDDDMVLKLSRDIKVKERYQYMIADCFVECNRLLKWCPRPECTNAIKVQYVDSQPVTCTCGHTFCFSCTEAWHEPVTCDLLRKWQKKCEDDRHTSNWISSNTKECPKCNAVIEKDGGCNHIVCKNQNCKTEFCWTCLGPWEPHGSSWYKCNRYDDEVAKTARNALEKSRMGLKRYLFHYNRYNNHMQKVKLEQKLHQSIAEKMEETKESITFIEMRFLKAAVDVLYKCRRTLMYTYVFAYYLKENNQSQIFKENQNDLEIATEKLSEYLEKNLRENVICEDLKKLKLETQDKSRYCEKRRKVLIEHVHEGYKKKWWERFE